MTGKSLAELRATSKVRLPERTFPLCLAQDLVARVQALEEEKRGLQVEMLGSAPDDADGDEPKKPRRAADPRQSRITDIDADLAAAYAEMREFTGDLIVRAIPAGEWRRWVDEHPARVESRDEQNRPILNPLDQQYTGGFCDANALADLLRKFAVSWNGAEITDADWSYVMDNAASGDVKVLCLGVVAMMEMAGSHAPKAPSSNVSSGTRSSVKS